MRKRNPAEQKKSVEGGILAVHRGADKVLFTIVFIVFVFHCFTLLFPVAWMIMSSMKEMNEYFLGDAFAFPKEWLFRNYIDAFTLLNDGKTTFVSMTLNSVWYTALSTSLSVFMPAITGYVLSKYAFPGRGVMYSIAIFAMTVPIVGAGAAYMRFIAEIGVYDTPLWVVINNMGGFGGTFLVYYGFFKSVSWAYAEAADIDGAGPFTIFFKIMLPQAVPIMLTYAITGAIGKWNEYESIILYLPSFPTLASGLFSYKSNAARANYPIYFAGLIISMIPTLLIFAFFSKKIMTSISIGGLKG